MPMVVGICYKRSLVYLHASIEKIHNLIQIVIFDRIPVNIMSGNTVRFEMF